MTYAVSRAHARTQGLPVPPSASHDERDRSLDWEFRRRMRANGEFRRCDVPFARFPFWAAGLVTDRSNEWALFGFAREGHVDFVWLNEGERFRVKPGLSVDRACRVAVEHGYDTILDVHNHPNPHPDCVDYSHPSDDDLRAVAHLASVANAFDLDVAAFVCQCGVPYEYAYHTPRIRGSEQPSFFRIPGFATPGAPVSTRGRDGAGRFLPRCTPEAARGLWPRSWRRR
jgi:hypothetical protein